MKIKFIQILIISSVLLLCGCTSLTSTPTTILPINDSVLNQAFNSWDLLAASDRLKTLEMSSKISKDDAIYIHEKIQERAHQKEALGQFTSELKEALHQNNITYVKNHTIKSFINNAMLSKLAEYNLSQATILIGGEVFQGNHVSAKLIATSSNQTAYFSVVILLKDHAWWIYSVKEIQ
jgi:hypothetical protein